MDLEQQNEQLRIANDLLKIQRDEFASISGIISGNLTELGNTNDAYKVSLSSARKLRSVSDQLLANSNEESNITAQQLEKLRDKARQENDILKSKIDSLEITNEQRASLQDIIDQGEELVKIAEERLRIEEAINEETGLVGDALSGVEGLLKKAGFGDLAKKLNFKGAIRDATTFDAKTGKATFNAAKGFGNIAKNLISAIKPTDILVAGLVKLFKAAKQADKNIANLRRSFGVSTSEAAKLNDQFAATAIRSGDVTANVESLTEANQAINKELGIQVRYNDELLVGVNALIKRNKISKEAAAAIAKSTLATGVAFNDYYDAAFNVSAELQNQSGITLDTNQILEDTNQITGQLRANLSRTPEGLVKAVATAKTLGVEMSEIAGIAGQLLDFESSITKELEAELLLGRDLNLEQARLLALNGKSDEAVASLVEQVGTLEDFQKLNVIQQQALASAVGMTADQLATTVEKQAAINSQKKDGLAIDAETMKEGASALSIQEQLSSAVTKLNSILQATSVIILGLVGAVGGFLLGGPIGAVIGLLAGAGTGIAMTGGIQGVEDGIAPPDRGPFTITDSYGATAVTAKGDGVAVSPNINQGTDNAEAKETNRLLRQILAKQGTVKIDSTQAGTAFAMNTYQVQ